ncbi:MAG: hypothetical protein ND895_27855, partial [Pyrinomonadaceae bacterium]|nr:hypothetical protein [Pyrinomonadaceae bacterium]
FQLGLLSDEYQSYRAELLSSDRAVVLTREGLKSESAGGNRIINLTLPATLLKRDDYRVRLSGRRAESSYEDLSSYVFRVVE